MCEDIKKHLMARFPDELRAFVQSTGLSEGELAGGLKGTCGGCPFNAGMTEEAEMAQNYGCLPTPCEIIQLKRTSGQNWACHSDETKVCAGLCHAAKPEGLNLAEGALLSYSSWYHKGPQAAVAQAMAQQ